MAGNTAPIFPAVGLLGTTRITAQQTGTGKSDGSGTIATDIFLAATGGTNGSYLKEIRLKAAAATAGTATTVTNIRVYVSTQGSGATTSANTKLIGELAVPSVTAGSTSVPTPDFTIPLNFVLPSGNFLLVGSGAAIAANTEFHAATFGGDY